MFLITTKLIWRQRNKIDEGLFRDEGEKTKENKHELLLIEVDTLASSENYKTSELYGHPTR